MLFMADVGRAQKPATLADLSWMTGCWETRQKDSIVEEIWSKPGGGSMLGLGRTVKNGRTVSFEFMQFREDHGTLVFLPQPHGGERVSFPLQESVRGRLTFENKTHDFPQRVNYQRKNKQLVASIEGTYQGKPEREEYAMKRVRCQ
jgi:hypothetical protein